MSEAEESQSLSVDQQIDQLRLEAAIHNRNRAYFEAQKAQNELRPSLLMYTVVRREGGHWMCIHPSSEDTLDCPVAYGESPDQAMRNFDALYMGKGLALDPEDPDNMDSELEDM